MGGLEWDKIKTNHSVLMGKSWGRQRFFIYTDVWESTSSDEKQRSNDWEGYQATSNSFGTIWLVVKLNEKFIYKQKIRLSTQGEVNTRYWIIINSPFTRPLFWFLRKSQGEVNKGNIIGVQRHPIIGVQRHSIIGIQQHHIGGVQRHPIIGVQWHTGTEGGNSTIVRVEELKKLISNEMRN